MSSRPDPVVLAVPLGFLAFLGPGLRLAHLVRAPSDDRRGLCGTRVFGTRLYGRENRTCGRCAVLHASADAPPRKEE